MDLDYLLSRHQKSLLRANTALCVSSRASHRALAAGYAERIREVRLVHSVRASAIAA